LQSFEVVQPVSYAVRVTRKLIALLIVAAVGVGGWLAYRWWSDDDVPLTFTTTEARVGDVIQAVTASGTLSPVIRVDVGSQISGRITELHADYNDTVKKGQLLARLDPEVNQSAVTQARARLTSARSDLSRARAQAANAKLEYQRAVELAKSGALSRSEVDAAELALRSAEAEQTSAASRITEAQASLVQAETNLAFTTITSPIDGIVIARPVNVGQTVAASMSAPILFTIAGDLREMEVHTSVAEADVGQLAEGMRVELAFDSFPEDLFEGTVKQVRYEATNVSNVVTYDAVVKIDNDKLKLRPGMTANATFIIAEARDVMVVPAKALRYRPPGEQAQNEWRGRGGSGSGGRGEGRRRRDGSAIGSGSSGSGSTAAVEGGGERRRRRPMAVYVLRDGKPVRVQVETGLTDGTNIEITGGELKDGDLVITADSKTKAPAQQGGSNQGGQRQRGPRSPFGR
jgi:HlyD family secretion protein